METMPATDKTQPISASHSPSSSRTHTSTSTLLSERFSAFFSDDELAVLSKGCSSKPIICNNSVLFYILNVLWLFKEWIIRVDYHF